MMPAVGACDLKDWSNWLSRKGLRSYWMRYNCAQLKFWGHR